MNLHRTLIEIDHAGRRAEFRGDQWSLALMGAFFVWVFWFLGDGWVAAFAVLMFTGARDKALRYRRTGIPLQTMGSIYRGSCPHDVAQRPLLRGWKPGYLYLPEHRKDRPDLFPQKRWGRAE